jgi:hypothetical protein
MGAYDVSARRIQVARATAHKRADESKIALADGIFRPAR